MNPPGTDAARPAVWEDRKLPGACDRLAGVDFESFEAPAGERLDVAIALALETSRTYAKELVNEGYVQLDGRPVAKPSTKLTGTELVTVLIPPRRPLTIEPEDIPLDIIYEDDHLAAINKPPGLVAHPTASVRTGTVVNALLGRMNLSKEKLFDEIVVDMSHRLRRAQGRAIAGIDDPLERLYVGTAASVRFIAGNYRLYGIISDQARGDRRRRETRARTQRIQADEATALLAEGQRRGVVRDGDPATFAHVNAGVVYSYVMLYAESRTADGRHELDIDDVAHGAASYVVRAVAASEAAAEAVLAKHAPGTVASA